jgi:thiol-disulfide isomerase/thioredoxin
MKLGKKNSTGESVLAFRERKGYILILKLILIIALANDYQSLQAQAADSMQPAYLRFPTLPPFSLLKVDSSGYFTKDDIKKNRPTLVMYFSPECEHCKHQTEDLLASIDQFKDIEIVMATLQPFNEMKDFYRYYRIADHSNIKMGRDVKAILPGFYKIHNLPYLALYDKKGKLITTFEGNQKIATLINGFNKGN